MSTRCQIRFQDEYEVAQIYRHYDGYPDGQAGVISDLKKLKDYLEKTGMFRGPAYLASQFIFWHKMNFLVSMKDHWGIESLEDILDPEKGDLPTFMLGHGVEDPKAGIHGDEEYLYIIELLPSGEWHLRVSRHCGFPRWDDPYIREAFERAEWEFEGSLEEAYKRYVRRERK